MELEVLCDHLSRRRFWTPEECEWNCATSREAAVFNSPVRQHGVTTWPASERRRCGTHPIHPTGVGPSGLDSVLTIFRPRPYGRGY